MIERKNPLVEILSIVLFRIIYSVRAAEMGCSWFSFSSLREDMKEVFQEQYKSTIGKILD